MRRLLILVALLLAGHTAFAEPPPHRVVMQINESDTTKWNAVFGSIRNIQAEFGRAKVAVTVVAIGPGLEMLTEDSLVGNKVEQAMEEGVRFVACENTMKAQQIARDDMLKRIDYTPAGYVEIVRLQEQGWSYLRP